VIGRLARSEEHSPIIRAGFSREDLASPPMQDRVTIVSLCVSNCSPSQLAKAVEIGFPQQSVFLSEVERVSDSPCHHMLALKARGVAVGSKQGRTQVVVVVVVVASCKRSL
jgi:hypothetical protein